MDYSYLRREYPETISMDQLYRICHISKRKARWLLEHGVIPCQDSGKQTRRFSIRLEEAICFLEQRDAGLLDDVIPQGIFSSDSSRPVRPTIPLLDEAEFCAYPAGVLGGLARYVDNPTGIGTMWVQCECSQPLVEAGADSGGEVSK